MRALIPKGGNDRVYTPDILADLIVNYFKPSGSVLEPCKGGGAFIRALNKIGIEADWCEIDEGRDFLTYNMHHDWIITNPPFSKFRDFLNHSMKISDNIVFLCFINSWFMKARYQDITKNGFKIVKIVTVPYPDNFPSTGFLLGAGYIQRGYNGDSILI